MKTEYAHSIFEIKSIDTEKREISGIATTPTPDRVRDVMDMAGAKFAPVIPLLLRHNHAEPIGEARLHQPTKDGIRFTAKLAKIDEPGNLKDRIDGAWQEIKSGLAKGVSIGFRSSAQDYMSDGGVRYKDYEIIELSVVTVPANSEATIQAIKSLGINNIHDGAIPLLSVKSKGGSIKLIK